VRVGILNSHPIQYHAPWFRGLAKELDLQVFFAHRPTPEEQATGFGGAFQWDIDLLSGYRHTFLPNKALRPGTDHFFGCDCPEIADIIRGQQDYGTTDNAKRDNETTDNGRRDHGTTDNETGPVVSSPVVSGQRRGRFDAFVVSGWNLKCYWQAVRACRRAGIPVLVRGDSQLNPTESSFKRAAKQITHRLMLRQFDGFLSPGQRNREYLLRYGVRAERIFFVPHCVDNGRFAKQANELRAKREELRRQWNIPQDALCVLFCGKFIPKKRPLDLVKAAEILLRSHPGIKIHLLFVGSGELGPELRHHCEVAYDAELRPQATGQRSDTINREQITDNTKPPATFAGFLNQTAVSGAYVAADVIVLPSDGGETWGLVVNEAMASGLPAIVSDAVGCAPDLIVEGGTGFTFECGNAAGLAEKIVACHALVENKSDTRAAVASKIRNYSVERALEGTLSAVEKCLERSART
jgi:glycosyltransferase involved in cell wall biosynthesis